MDDLLTLLRDVYLKAGGREEDFLPTDEDSPIPFSGENFVRSIEANAEILNTTDYSDADASHQDAIVGCEGEKGDR